MARETRLENNFHFKIATSQDMETLEVELLWYKD